MGLRDKNNSQTSTGIYVPTTNIWDVQSIQSAEINSKEFKELLVRLYQNINIISTALNLKESGYYLEQEFLTSQLFFPQLNTLTEKQSERQTFRMVINFGPLPNTATTSVPHGLNIGKTYTVTRIYGSSTQAGATLFIPIPYASPTLTENIAINIDQTNVNITTAMDYSDYTITYVIFEYLKN